MLAYSTAMMKELFRIIIAVAINLAPGSKNEGESTGFTLVSGSIGNKSDGGILAVQHQIKQH